MAKINKVVKISLSGGIIGFLTTNPRAALERRVMLENAEGWNVHQIMPHDDRNVAMLILKLLVLFLTLFLWTWGAGYILLLEKDR